MKVIVVARIGFGNSTTDVYKYTREKYIQMIKDEYNERGKYIENKEEVEDWLEDEEPYDISIIEYDYGIHYAVCDVKEYQGGKK